MHRSRRASIGWPANKFFNGVNGIGRCALQVQRAAFYSGEIDVVGSLMKAAHAQVTVSCSQP